MKCWQPLWQSRKRTLKWAVRFGRSMTLLCITSLIFAQYAGVDRSACLSFYRNGLEYLRVSGCIEALCNKKLLPSSQYEQLTFLQHLFVFIFTQKGSWNLNIHFGWWNNMHASTGISQQFPEARYIRTVLCCPVISNTENSHNIHSDTSIFFLKRKITTLKSGTNRNLIYQWAAWFLLIQFSSYQS